MRNLNKHHLPTHLHPDSRLGSIAKLLIYPAIILPVSRIYLNQKENIYSSKMLEDNDLSNPIYLGRFEEGIVSLRANATQLHDYDIQLAINSKGINKDLITALQILPKNLVVLVQTFDLQPMNKYMILGDSTNPVLIKENNIDTGLIKSNPIENALLLTARQPFLLPTIQIEDSTFS